MQITDLLKKEGSWEEMIKYSPEKKVWRRDAMSLKTYVVNEQGECMWIGAPDLFWKPIKNDDWKYHADWHPLIPEMKPKYT